VTAQKEHNGRLPQCIAYQSRAEQQIEAICREMKDMKIANHRRDESVEALRLTLARWGGVLAVITIAVGILGPVIARSWLK